MIGFTAFLTAVSANRSLSRIHLDVRLDQEKGLRVRQTKLSDEVPNDELFHSRPVKALRNVNKQLPN